jgi:hypothetical protein
MANDDDPAKTQAASAALFATLPESVQQRVKTMQDELNTTIAKATSVLETQLPGPVAFSIKTSPTADFFTEWERAQCISFVARYQHLPRECVASIVKINDQYYINNFDFLRHTLNDYRPIIQNQDDAVYYKKVHNVWWAMLARTDENTGTTVRAIAGENKTDVTPVFMNWLGERNKAIGVMLKEMKFDYLYNGILQHSDMKFTMQFLDDYTSGSLNYVLWKHAHALGLIRRMLEPYYLLANTLNFPKLGSL